MSARLFAQDPAAVVADALGFIPPGCDRETWVAVGMAVKAALGEGGFALWDAWSQGADCYRPKDALSAWKSFKADGKTGAGTLFYFAKRGGWTPQGRGLPALAPAVRNPAQEAARRAAQQARHEAAARKAGAIWRHSTPAAAHPYLTAKGIQAHGARLFKGALVLPLFDASKQLANLQFIHADGGKRFLKGGRKSGCFWWLGRASDPVCLAEGYATAASIHEATGHCCFIAFDAGNLPRVGQIIRAGLPRHGIVVCADHDPAGIKFAVRTAASVGAALALPGEPGQDFNDRAGGGHGRA